MPLGPAFWRRFAAIENVIAIEAAPFNRHHALDVIRGVVEAGAEDRIAVHTDNHTGNDDHIVLDLPAPFAIRRGARKSGSASVRIEGGLPGRWSVWTGRAVEILARVHAAIEAETVDADPLALDSRVTDCNGAVLDAADGYRGGIAGRHETLRRQGLPEGVWRLDSREGLSPGFPRGAEPRTGQGNRPRACGPPGPR